MFAFMKYRFHRCVDRLELLVGLGWLSLLCVALWPSAALASDFPALDEAIAGAFVAELAPVFDFDGNSCLPSAGISRSGQRNGGLKNTGDITGQCRSSNFLETSNTIHRFSCASVGEDLYCAHVYGLYFEKDGTVINSTGHRHDWEMAIVWTKNGDITHGSVSEHGGFNTKQYADLPLENGHMKVVYHKESIFGGGTHAFRFGGQSEVAENPYHEWVTPAITGWFEFEGDTLSNEEMRTLMNGFSYGSANMPARDDYFLSKVNQYRPSGYPEFDLADPMPGPQAYVTADDDPVTGPIVVEDGTMIQFDTTAHDPDGLGYPIFAWAGNDTPFSYLWNLDGAAVPHGWWLFTPSPPVTFDLPAGEATRTYDLSVSVWDTTGESTTVPITVTATQAPEVAVNANGEPVTGPIAVGSGTTIQFETIASDEDGLGYPIFAWMGNDGPVSYAWDFDGATVPDPLWYFAPSPPVTFTLEPGETFRTFEVSVGVWDALGIETVFPIQVDVTQ
jgi:hypothetical protein